MIHKHIRINVKYGLSYGLVRSAYRILIQAH